SISFQEEDRILFSSLEEGFSSFEDLSKSNFEQAFEYSKKVMYTPGLTPELYKFVFKAYSIAKLALMDKQFSSSLQKISLAKDYGFNEFQNDQCSDLCNSIGWTVLVQNMPNVFTQDGMSKFIVNKNILDML